MTNIWFTSDTHFGHENIIRYCNRPFDTLHYMNAALTDNWNSVVKDGDTVVHCGDFAHPRCRDASSYLSRLNGSIILVRGNHDKRDVCNQFMWVERMQVSVGEFKCVVNHRPFYPPELVKNDIYHDHEKMRDIADFDFVISGHVHEKYRWVGKSVNVGVDVNYFRPVHIDELEQKLRLRKEAVLQPGFVKGDANDSRG